MMKKDILTLIPAEDVPSSQIMQFRKEFLDAGEHAINGSRGLHNYEKYEDWLHLVQECSKPNNKLIGVETTTYFASRKADNKLVGCIELRHTLNQALEEIGGHVGYSVLPTERRKGYATLMLEMIIDKSKELGIDKLLLTCDIDNVGSNKTVVGCGGILAGGNPFSYKGEQIYKYWINV